MTSLVDTAARRSANRRLSFSAIFGPSARFALISLSQTWRSDLVAKASSNAVRSVDEALAVRSMDLAHRGTHSVDPDSGAPSRDRPNFVATRVLIYKRLGD